MGYRNSNAYVQRQMDIIMKGKAGRSYCDDMFGASDTLEQHVHEVAEVLRRICD